MAKISGSPSRKKSGSRFGQEPSATIVDLSLAAVAKNASVVWAKGDNGKITDLTLRWPTPNGLAATQEIKISYWLEFPLLSEPIADALLTWGADKTERTRISVIGALRTHFFPYFQETSSPEVSLADIDRAWLAEFRVWLDKKDIKPATRSHAMFAVRYLIDTLKSIPKWKRGMVPNLKVQHTTRGLKKSQTPFAPVDASTFDAMLKAAEAEVAETMALLTTWWRDVPPAVERERIAPSSRADLCGDEIKTLAALELCPVSDFFTQRELKANGGGGLGHIISDHHGGLTRLRMYRFPTPRELVPFVLLLAAPTGYNTTTLLELRLSDINIVDGFAGRKMRLTPYKGRADAVQPKLFRLDDERPFAVHTLINFILAWTKRARAIAEPRIQDHLFLMAPRQSGKGVERAISTYQGSPQLWYQNLQLFLTEHGLDSVGISAIRKTMEGVVNRLFHGDIKARQVFALHASAETTHGSYTTAENRQYYAEKIAEIQNAQIRWVATKGNADPRDQGYNKLSAVTLGFDCLDPYDSPITGQKPGRLCQAYGACIACPLANVNPTKPESLARLLQLQDAIQKARVQMAPKRWLSVWANRLELLQRMWLPQFVSSTVAMAAEKLSLPPLPPLE